MVVIILLLYKTFKAMTLYDFVESEMHSLSLECESSSFINYKDLSRGGWKEVKINEIQRCAAATLLNI
jgi:hypothetical protein